MNPIFEMCKEKLEAERVELTESIASLSPDSANEEQDAESQSLVQTLQETLDDITHALAKLDAGTYGVCEGCKGNVGNARLYEMPAARLCVECAEKAQ
jgi:RNA polymerase-binding transcription factor DksA